MHFSALLHISREPFKKIMLLAKLGSNGSNKIILKPSAFYTVYNIYLFNYLSRTIHKPMNWQTLITENQWVHMLKFWLVMRAAHPSGRFSLLLDFGNLKVQFNL